MSANVETMFTARVPAWHGLGTVVKEALTSEEAIRLAELDWDVTAKPLYLDDGTLVPGKVANVRSSDNKVLGVVGTSYKIVQNKEAFDFVDAVLNNGDVEVKFETAGALDGGRRIWLLANLPARRVVGDEVVPYLVFTNSHDGYYAITAAMTPTRVVCQNTLTAALGNTKRKWTVRHVGNFQAKLNVAQHTLGLASKYMDAFIDKADVLEQIKITQKKFDDILNAVFPLKEQEEGEEVSRTNQNVIKLRSGVTDIWRTADDLQPFRNTAWGVVNAFADFASHAEPLRKTDTYAETRFASLVNGTNLVPEVQKAIELVA